MAPSAWRHRHLLVSVWPPVSGHQSKKKGCAIVSMSPCPAAVLGQGSQAGVWVAATGGEMNRNYSWRVGMGRGCLLHRRASHY